MTEKLKAVPGGKMYLTGGPRLGKSRFCRQIVRAAVDAPLDTEYPALERLPVEDLNKLESQVTHATGEEVFETGDIWAPSMEDRPRPRPDPRGPPGLVQSTLARSTERTGGRRSPATR